MNETFRVEEAVELAVVERSGFVESRHIGSAVVTGPDGAVIVGLGAPDAPVLTRSCLKPFQAIACMGAGVSLDGTQAVLTTASHVAERGHADVVRALLERGNLRAQDLQCPTVEPADVDHRIFARSHGSATSPIYFNCSGKHAAFLLAQKANDEPTADYLKPDSFIQRRVVETVDEYCGATPVFTGVDGCGAPVHALPLTALARGVGRVAQGATPHAATLTRAVLDNPWAIEGHGKPNSVAIEELGVFAKFGAEGVIVIATTSGYCAAVKTLDGAKRINSLVALTLLSRVGALDAEKTVPVAQKITPAITGGTHSGGTPAVVGSIRLGSGFARLNEQPGSGLNS